MEIALDTIATLVAIVGGVGLILHRHKAGEAKIIEWRTRLETEVEHLKAAMQTYNDRLRKHGEESDDVRATVHEIKREIAVLRTQMEKDLSAIREQVERLANAKG